MGELQSNLIEGSEDTISPQFSSLVMSTLWFLENNTLHVHSEVPALAPTCPKNHFVGFDLIRVTI